MMKEMFFRLQLIQSYGSGIRRAKNAMEQIGSPDLVFKPENDSDDYTLVTAYINEEFARIRDEEQSFGGNNQENNQEKNLQGDIESRILDIMRDNDHVTRSELVKILGVSEETVRYRMEKLKSAGRIKHQGSTKAGRWIVINESDTD